jgi:hypothetical protein
LVRERQLRVALLPNQRLVHRLRRAAKTAETKFAMHSLGVTPQRYKKLLRETDRIKLSLGTPSMTLPQLRAHLVEAQPSVAELVGAVNGCAATDAAERSNAVQRLAARVVSIHVKAAGSLRLSTDATAVLDEFEHAECRSKLSVTDAKQYVRVRSLQLKTALNVSAERLMYSPAVIAEMKQIMAKSTLPMARVKLSSMANLSVPDDSINTVFAHVTCCKARAMSTMQRGTSKSCVPASSMFTSIAVTPDMLKAPHTFVDGARLLRCVHHEHETHELLVRLFGFHDTKDGKQHTAKPFAQGVLKVGGSHGTWLEDYALKLATIDNCKTPEITVRLSVQVVPGSPPKSS